MQDPSSLDWVIAAMNSVSMEREQVRPVVIVTHQKKGETTDTHLSLMRTTVVRYTPEY